ncbi:uncharacterized protein F5891DRAFT_1069586, partial [Suillus fuscotomentosus]
GHQGRPRNVVLYGESGVGKSSLINLIMGRDAAKTSPDALACTTTHAPYDATITGNTSGWFNEGSEGTVPAVMAERNLTAFLRGLNQEDGVHLLIYCVRGNASNKGSQSAHDIVVTCLEDFRPVMAEWWNENKDELATVPGYSPTSCTKHSRPLFANSSQTWGTEDQRSFLAILLQK